MDEACSSHLSVFAGTQRSCLRSVPYPDQLQLWGQRAAEQASSACSVFWKPHESALCPAQPSFLPHGLPVPLRKITLQHRGLPCPRPVLRNPLINFSSSQDVASSRFPPVLHIARTSALPWASFPHASQRTMSPPPSLLTWISSYENISRSQPTLQYADVY